MLGDGTRCDRGFCLLHNQGETCRTSVVRNETLFQVLLLWPGPSFTGSRGGASVG
jgi:hypothetical protein